MRPTEWAMEDKLDPNMFNHWANQLMEKREYEELKKGIYNSNKYK